MSEYLGRFNSIKVRLELTSFCQALLLVWSFNSIKVRLEQWGNMIINTLMTFQFHKGTIRTRANKRGRFDLSQFQFHKGTIRTDKDKLLSGQVFQSFNSIKVRLEQERILHRKQHQSYVSIP